MYNYHHAPHTGLNILFILLAIWTLVWKGYSLWTAAKRNQRKWFIVLLLLNTLAILDIYYIFYVAKKTPKEVWRAFNRKVFTVRK